MQQRGTVQRRRTERGAAALEFALVLVPLLMILGGIVNFGVAFSQKLALDNAVREAGRAAAVDLDSDTITADAVTSFNEASIARSGEVATITLDSSCEDSEFGDQVVASGSFESTFLFPWMLPGLPSTINWDSEASFQCEYS